jgi:hypothetical protein
MSEHEAVVGESPNRRTKLSTPVVSQIPESTTQVATFFTGEMSLSVEKVTPESQNP